MNRNLFVNSYYFLVMNIYHFKCASDIQIEKLVINFILSLIFRIGANCADTTVYGDATYQAFASGNGFWAQIDQD